MKLSTNVECGLHTYGLACRTNCGNCSTGEACNHVNGWCPRGCDRGVQGEKCQDGMNKKMHRRYEYESYFIQCS